MLPCSLGTVRYVNLFMIRRMYNSGRVDRASATETVDLDSIPGRVKPKSVKISIHSFPAWRSAIEGTVLNLHRVC